MTITTPMMNMKPDFTPVARAFALQTRIAGQSSETMLRLALLPWNSWNAGLTALKTTPAAKPAAKAKTAPVAVAKAKVAKPAPKTIAKPPVEVVAETVAPVAAPKLAPVAKEPVAKTPVAAKPKAVAPVAPAKTVATPVAEKPVAKAKPVVAAGVAETKPEPKAAAKVETKVDAKPEIKAAPKAEPKVEAKVDAGKPEMLKAARNGQPDDLTQLKGVGPKLALALQEAGIYHYDQIAEWTDVQTAWVDENIAGVRGRASRNDWVEQALELATA